MSDNIKNKLKSDIELKREKSRTAQKRMEDLDKLRCIQDTDESGYETLLSLIESSCNLKKLFHQSLSASSSSQDPWIKYTDLLTGGRKDRISKVASERTHYIRVAIQDIFHKHNISACLRSCEAFGVLNVDIINTKDPRSGFRPSSASKGVERWLNLGSYQSIKDYCKMVKDMGYKIAAAYPPHYNTVPISELSVDCPLVLAFGNEHDGLSSEWESYVDIFYTIPMYGMVESLNISVSCGISLNHVISKARSLVSPDKFFLTEPEKNALVDSWLQKHFAWIK